MSDLIATSDLVTADYEQNSSDYYNEDYEDEMCVKTEVRKFGAIVTTVFFSVVIVFSVVGNLLVLVILGKYENLKSMTNAFLLNLALSDLIFTLGLPFWASYDIHNWIFGKTACKAVSFIFDVGYYSSIIFLTTMTIHRYMAVVHPMSVVISRKSFYCVVTSSIVWVASCLAATPALLFKTSYVNNNDNSLHCEYESTRWKLVGTYQRNVFFLISFAVIIFCYTQILLRLFRPNSHTRHKTVRLILIIVVVFFLGWAPYNVTLFLQSLAYWQLKPFDSCKINITVDYVFYVGRLLAFSHCCLNPIFYMFMGIKFRNHLKQLLWYCGDTTNIHRRHSRLIYSNASMPTVTSFQDQF
ncbi:chemokine XC receptor 1 [Alosa sapidissima]|uniref:chemokine XC receptor 1 n=1 Tax=Alosa sapidissima TaxID=34773 RepID=UPI001C09C23F|nr:chemokine XC receptor 1 [Alosa sapidissima]